MTDRAAGGLPGAFGVELDVRDGDSVSRAAEFALPA